MNHNNCSPIKKNSAILMFKGKKGGKGGNKNKGKNALCENGSLINAWKRSKQAETNDGNGS